MEVDPPHESDGSTTGSKENEIFPVFDNHSGEGSPYAPEDFPNPGDKWGWKVGKRVGPTGYFVDRYLLLPRHIHTKYKSWEFRSGGFASKASVERFLLEAFPGTDIKAFFDSFTWKIPAGKGNKEIVSLPPNCYPQFDPAGCKAGNIMCSSLLETSDPLNSDVITCDICCIEPRFCRDCCCILCSRTVNSANSDHSFIRCEARVEDGLICGHIAHIECGLRSYMAGTVGGTIGLDAEYYCRRCDARTDLVPHVKNLLQSCESIRSGDKIEKIFNICVLILRGSRKTSAKTLLQDVQSAIGKLKEGNSHEDASKREDTSAVTTVWLASGELSPCETDTFEVSNVKEPLQRDTTSLYTLITTFNYQLESLKLENRIKETLIALKKSQQVEYGIAVDVLMAQKNHLLELYKEMDKEKEKLAKCSPLADPTLINGVLKRMDQIRKELAKVTLLEGVGKGFGKTSKKILKEQFGVETGE